MFQFEDATAAMHKAVRRRIEAAMETGNFDHARTVLGEYADVHPAHAKVLRADLIPAYGTALW